jgi:hypothetical protein
MNFEERDDGCGSPDRHRSVVIRRTFEGYVTEKKTIYEQLEERLGVKILPAPDEWDRRYNVDFSCGE